MDPNVVAVAAASLLATKLGEGFAGEASKSAWDAAKKLSGLIRSKFAGDSEATTALEDLQAGPLDQARVRAVAATLQAHTEGDEAFRVELETLVAAIEQDQSRAKVVTEIFGNARVVKVATIGDVHGDVSF